MATSQVAIANGALQRLGTKRIEALDQNHPNARTMNAAFDKTLRAELRRYDWTFATKRASIAADGDYDEWGDWLAYSKPNDFLRLVRDDESGYVVDYKIEGLFILSKNASPLEIIYIAFIEDPNAYDPLFIEALECKLALVTCEEVTQSTSKKAKIQEDYDTAIAEAKRVGSIEKSAQEFPQDTWLTVRL